MLAESGEILGIKEGLPVSFFEKVAAIYAHIGEFNVWCLIIALFTFGVSKVRVLFAVCAFSVVIFAFL